MRKVDILVIGGGIAGLSTAYYLAKAGQNSVLVLEQEKKLGGHASGRNAGMLRQALSDPLLAELAVRSRKVFDRASKRGWNKLNLQSNGSLFLSKNQDGQALENIASTIRMLGLKPSLVSKTSAVKKSPVLRQGNFDLALFCPTDATLDIDALLRGFLRNLKIAGVRVQRGEKLKAVHPADGGFLVHAGAKKWFCKKVVNAAGAWASWVGDKAGATPVPLAAYRRHLFFTKPDSVIRSRWPFVWDLSHDFYFRPLGRTIMLSPCDKTPEALGDRREKVNPEMRGVLYEKLKTFSGSLADLCVERAQSGLRTMAPDGRFVLGEDAKLKNFYWVAALGGHGVTTCFSVGELSADMILGKRVDPCFEKALSPARFSEVFHAA